MFVCPAHGKLESEWCDDCGTINKCDCSDVVSARQKDILFNYENGTGNFTVWFKYCDTCGDFKGFVPSKSAKEE